MNPVVRAFSAASGSRASLFDEARRENDAVHHHRSSVSSHVYPEKHKKNVVASGKKGFYMLKFQNILRFPLKKGVIVKRSFPFFCLFFFANFVKKQPFRVLFGLFSRPIEKHPVGV